MSGKGILLSFYYKKNSSPLFPSNKETGVRSSRHAILEQRSQATSSGEKQQPPAPRYSTAMMTEPRPEEEDDSEMMEMLKGVKRDGGHLSLAYRPFGCIPGEIYVAMLASIIAAF